MTRILIVGAGGREYAVAKKLTESPETVYLTVYAPGLDQDAPIASLGSCLILGDESGVWNLAAKKVFDVVFIGPEKYLAEGYVDRFQNEFGIPCIGPTKALARLETSKIWARRFIELYMNVNPKYTVFTPEQVGAFENHVNAHAPNVVVKADGLHGGKGVLVCDEQSDGSDAIVFGKQILARGESLLVEERLRGDEFSLMSFTDGNTIIHMPPIQDFKRAYENDQGPNTGSMGALTHVHPRRLSFLTDEDISECRNINNDVLGALDTEEGLSFCGILYGSFMKIRHPRKGESAIRVIEYNVRFGDPECMIALALLKTDLHSIFKAMASKTLHTLNLAWSSKAAVVKYLVPEGYPTKPRAGAIFSLPTLSPGLTLYYGDCREMGENRYVLGSSRTLAVLATSAVSTQDAAARINAWLDQVHASAFYRRDIGLESNVYQLSGVNIDEGNRVVGEIQKHVETTFNAHTVSRFGDFSGLFALNGLGYRDPILVTSMDGVGTKSLFVLKHYDPLVAYAMLGRDLVNHSVNDCLVKGAKPLFFLDYFATRHVRADHVGSFVRGVAEACRTAGCVLIGGETAEMPDVYANTEPNPFSEPKARLTIASDLVGTMVGIVERDAIIDGKTAIHEGDVVLGWSSSGPHTNGYSMIRHITKKLMLSKDEVSQLAATHRSYMPEVTRLRDANIPIHGLSHITGGGFEENVPRMLPSHLAVAWDKFDFAPIFTFLQRHGQISNAEMRRVFNCGIGMVVVVPQTVVDAVRRLVPETRTMGRIVKIETK